MVDQSSNNASEHRTQPNPALNQAAKSRKATQDEQLLEAPSAEQKLFTETDPWRVLRIQGEFVEGFEALADLARWTSCSSH